MQEVQQVELKKPITQDPLADVFNTYHYSDRESFTNVDSVSVFKDLVRELGIHSFVFEIEENGTLAEPARGGITVVKVSKVSDEMITFLLNVLGFRFGTEDYNERYSFKNSYSCFRVYSKLRAKELKKFLMGEISVEDFNLIAQERTTDAVGDSSRAKLLAKREGFRSMIRFRITSRYDMSWRRLIYKKIDDERREFEEAKITELT